MLTEQEKVMIRHHLGYLNVSEVATFGLGIPASVETAYLVEAAMNKIIPAAIPLIRHHIALLSKTEEQMVCGQDEVGVDSLGSIKLNNQGENRGQRELRRVYNYWARSLSNLLGCPRNPFDSRAAEFGLRGINVRVQH